jgi:CelD/BcsL family acetyltransferase involved in cellulose biosynthesis
MSAGLSTAIIREAAAFAALAPAWGDLWRRAPTATPFQSPAWLIPWWRAFAPGKLFTVAVARADRLVGLAPFYIEDGAYGRRLLPVGISLSDYLDVLVDPDEPDAGRAVVEALSGERAAWDLWSLEELRLGATALGLPLPSGCRETLSPQSACPVLRLDGGRSLSEILLKTKRRKLNLARNRAARRGPVTVERADAAEVGPALDRLFDLHGSRWESRGEAGVLADDAVRGFQRAAAPALQAEDLLRLYVLRIGDAVAAIYYGFAYKGEASAYLTGFDPAFAYESPGTLVVAHAIEQAIAEGANTFHFLRGQEAYKYEWGATDRWNQRRTIQHAETHVALA